MGNPSTCSTDELISRLSNRFGESQWQPFDWNTVYILQLDCKDPRVRLATDLAAWADRFLLLELYDEDISDSESALAIIAADMAVELLALTLSWTSRFDVLGTYDSRFLHILEGASRNTGSKDGYFGPVAVSDLMKLHGLRNATQHGARVWTHWTIRAYIVRAVALLNSLGALVEWREKIPNAIAALEHIIRFERGSNQLWDYVWAGLAYHWTGDLYRSAKVLIEGLEKNRDAPDYPLAVLCEWLGNVIDHIGASGLAKQCWLSAFQHAQNAMNGSGNDKVVEYCRQLQDRLQERVRSTEDTE